MTTTTFTRRHGALPQPPKRFVVTDVTLRIAAAAETAVFTGGIVAIDGECGIGKTTAAADAARNMDSHVVYVLISTTTSPRANLVNMWEAMTGTSTKASEREVRRDIVDFLLNNSITLLMDDAHHIHKRGLQLITGIWNEVHAARGFGTPMVLIGNDLASNLSVVPEIVSRFRAEYTAGPLSTTEMVAAVHQISPRAIHTDPELLKELDRFHFKGRLRDWVNFFELLAFISPEAEDDDPIDAKEISQFLGRRRSERKGRRS